MINLQHIFLFLCCCCLSLTACGNRVVVADTHTSDQPTLFPDYNGVTFPANIAPPNFMIRETGDAYYTEIGVGGETLFTVRNTSGEVLIPTGKWEKIRTLATGMAFYIRVFISREGRWTQYLDITNMISPNTIDPYLVYRLLYPGYELWNEMGIYQRDLTTFNETPLIENRSVEKGCMNCHAFSRNSPDRMMLHVRGKVGGTLVAKDGKVESLDTKAPGMNHATAYPSWHPDGKHIAFSVNEINQYFHSTGHKAVEVSDKYSDLVVLDTETNQLFTDSLICGEDWMETFPHWSPDGKALYFCRARAITADTPLDSIRYDLCRVAFDPATRRFSNLECLVEASAWQQSISFPRISPDGRYLMYVLMDYGNFSIWHPEGDLYLLDLQTGESRNMAEVNSSDVDSYHSWSSTGRWFVFSSKRMDGLWAHPYIASFDPETGRAGKPFMLPQQSPAFYTSFTKTFNIPELITGPVTHGDAMVERTKRPPVPATFR